MVGLACNETDAHKNWFNLAAPGMSVESGLQTETISVEWDAATSGRAVVRLAGNLTVNVIETVHDALPAVLARAESVAIDADRLQAVDLAGIQLLIAGRRYAERVGKLFHLTAPADGALREALIAAGLVGVGGEESGSGDDGWVDALWIAG